MKKYVIGFICLMIFFVSVYFSLVNSTLEPHYNTVADYIEENGNDKFYNFYCPSYYLEGSKKETLIDYNDIMINHFNRPDQFYSFVFSNIGKNHINIEIVVDYTNKEEYSLDTYELKENNIYTKKSKDDIRFLYKIDKRTISIHMTGEYMLLDQYEDIGIQMIKDSIKLNN